MDHPDQHPELPDCPGVLGMGVSPDSPPVRRDPLPGVTSARTVGHNNKAQPMYSEKDDCFGDTLWMSPEIGEGAGLETRILKDTEDDVQHATINRKNVNECETDLNAVTPVDESSKLLGRRLNKDDIRPFLIPSMKTENVGMNDCDGRMTPDTMNVVGTTSNTTQVISTSLMSSGGGGGSGRYSDGVSNNCEDTRRRMWNVENDRDDQSNIASDEAINDPGDNTGEGVKLIECDIVKKSLRCNNHDCAVEKVKVTSKKWGWISRLSKYGYINSQSTKYICKAKKSGVAANIKPEYNCTVAKRGLAGWDLGSNTRGFDENNGDESESFGARNTGTETS